MKCPSCGVPFSTPPAACPKCKLTLTQLDPKFGLVPYCSRYLSDRSERLTGEEIDNLRAALRLFERKFPQIIFAVLVVNLGEQIPMSEYAFWLGNRARFSSVSAVGPKNFDLLLIVDPQGQAVRHSLHALGYPEVGDVRIGKYLELRLADVSRESANERVREMCERLLANRVIEDARFEIVEHPGDEG